MPKVKYAPNLLVPSQIPVRERTILVAEDDPVMRRILQKRLGDWGYEVILAENGEKAWDVLEHAEDPPAIVILDWLMPGMDGIEICRRIRAKQLKSYQYILLISGKDEKQEVVEGLDAGADDYLTKPFDLGEMRARLRAGMRVLALQRDLLEAHEALRYQATHDSLTGLRSRGAILDLLTCELDRGRRSDGSTGVLMIDVDRFKGMNDVYGHLVGDAVLREIAKRITAAVRSYDFVGRYGGEEFIAVLSNCSWSDLSSIAERAREVVARDPIVVQSESIAATVSVGGYVARNGTSDAELLSEADKALYEAKRAGRNRVVIGKEGNESRYAVAGKVSSF